MNTRFGLSSSVVWFVVLALTITFSAAQVKTQWRTGRLVAADLSGHGQKPGASGTRSKARGEIWWAYCVSSDGKAYSAVSRLSPDKAGLTVGRSVQFSVDRKQITMLNPKGKRHVMQIVRQGDESICR